MLNANRVEYLLIDGWAVSYYGYPRYTLLVNKRASNRLKDLVDIEGLSELTP